MTGTCKEWEVMTDEAGGRGVSLPEVSSASQKELKCFLPGRARLRFVFRALAALRRADWGAVAQKHAGRSGGPRCCSPGEARQRGTEGRGRKADMEEAALIGSADMWMGRHEWRQRTGCPGQAAGLREPGPSRRKG